jgi:hypothetical protein
MARALNLVIVLIADRRPFPTHIHNIMRAPSIPPTFVLQLPHSHRRTGLSSHRDAPQPHDTLSQRAYNCRTPAPACSRLPLRVYVTRPLEHADGRTNA